MLHTIISINSLSIKNFHSSSIHYADMNTNINQAFNTENNFILDQNQNIADLQLIPFEPVITREQLKDLNISSYADSFSWFYDENGKMIDYNKPIRLFNGVKLISNYLEKKTFNGSKFNI